MECDLVRLILLRDSLYLQVFKFTTKSYWKEILNWQGDSADEEGVPTTPGGLSLIPGLQRVEEENWLPKLTCVSALLTRVIPTDKQNAVILIVGSFIKEGSMFSSNVNSPLSSNDLLLAESQGSTGHDKWQRAYMCVFRLSPPLFLCKTIRIQL